MKKRPAHIEQFYSEPKVKALFGNCKKFVKFAKAHKGEPDGVATIQKHLRPVIIPVELELDIRDLWRVTMENLR